MSSEWTLRVHADAWRSSIGAAAAKASIERLSGCYAVTDPSTGLRILNLNTGFAYKSVRGSLLRGAADARVAGRRTSGSTTATTSSPIQMASWHGLPASYRPPRTEASGSG